jgi:AcrR family transcriptional regulator
MSSKPSSTGELILRTAEELFATKGIDAVSLNEINKAAGQRNTSSLHYHFGSKEGLIQAIVYTHYAEIETWLQRGLDELEAGGGFTTRQLVETVTAPFIHKLHSQSGIHYLRIVTQLLNKSADMLIVGHPAQEDRARVRVFALFDRVSGGMPDDVRIARIVLFSSLLFHSLASFAQFEESGKGNPLGSEEFFAGNLREMLVAMIAAPINRI